MTIVVRGLTERKNGRLPRPRAVLFDLDDTLIDRSLTLLRFAERFARDFADRLVDADPAHLHPLIRAADRGGYRTREELTRNLLALLPWRNAPSAGILTRYWADHAGACSTASPGALGLITWLRARGLKVGVVTNGPPTQHNKIDALGVRSHLDVIAVSDELGCAKPEPNIFHHALRALGVKPEETWFVGDHPVNDVAGATELGMHAFWLRRQLDWPDGQPEAGAWIDSLDELLPLLVDATDGGRRKGAGAGALAATQPG